MKKDFKISGMSCKHCVARVEDGLKALEGVQKVKVNLKKGVGTVKFDESITDTQKIADKIVETGYQAEVM